MPSEVEREMQERARRRSRGEAARLAERGKEVPEREHRVKEKEEAMAHGAHWVIPDPHGFRGTVAIQEKGKREGRRGWASAGKGTPGGGAGRGGSNRGAAAHQLQPRTDAKELRFGVPAAAAVCAASGA